MNKFLEFMQAIPPDIIPEINCRKIPRTISKKLKKAAYVASVENKIHVVFPVFRKRAFTLALIIILTCAASAFVYAESEPVQGFVSEAAQVVKKFFTREEELIDQNAVFIDNSTVSDDITLTVEKAVRDGETVYLYYTLTSKSGFSGDALMYDNLTLSRKSDSTDGFLPVYNNFMGEKGILAGNILFDLNNNILNEIKLILKLENFETGEYRMDIDRLFSATSGQDSDTEMYYTEYLKHLSTNFSLDALMNDLPVVEYEPETPIYIDEYTLTFEKIRITPISIELIISDRLGQLFEFNGYTFTALDYLKQFTSPLNITPKRGEELTKFLKETQEKRLDSYSIYIEFKNNLSSIDTSQSGSRWNYFLSDVMKYEDYKTRKDFLEKGDCIYYTSYLTSPIYPEDIERIYLESGNSRYYGGEKDIIVLWENGTIK